MTATRENLITEARNIRYSLEGLPAGEIVAAIREVLRLYAPKAGQEELDGIIHESMEEIQTAS